MHLPIVHRRDRLQVLRVPGGVVAIDQGRHRPALLLPEQRVVFDLVRAVALEVPERGLRPWRARLRGLIPYAAFGFLRDSPELLKFYWNTERRTYLARCSAEALGAFQNVTGTDDEDALSRLLTGPMPGARSQPLPLWGRVRSGP